MFHSLYLLGAKICIILDKRKKNSRKSFISYVRAMGECLNSVKEMQIFG